VTKQWLGSTSEIKSLAPTWELARPHKQRFELAFIGKTAIQVYDDTHGWKLRPFLNRREVGLLTPEEMEIAPGQAELDGWLMDYAAKGAKIQLVGMERLTIEGSGLVDRHVGVGARRIKMSTNCARPARQSRHAVLDGLREQRPPSEIGNFRAINLVKSVVASPKLDDTLFMAPNPNAK